MPGLDAQIFNWDNMSNDDVAKLMLYCGQAVQMDYGTDASGAVSELAANAFKEVFGFSAAASYEYRSHYDDDAWDTLIYTEPQPKPARVLLRLLTRRRPCFCD